MKNLAFVLSFIVGAFMSVLLYRSIFAKQYITHSNFLDLFAISIVIFFIVYPLLLVFFIKLLRIIENEKSSYSLDFDADTTDFIAEYISVRSLCSKKEAISILELLSPNYSELLLAIKEIIKLSNCGYPNYLIVSMCLSKISKYEKGMGGPIIDRATGKEIEEME